MKELEEDKKTNIFLCFIIILTGMIIAFFVIKGV